MIVVGLCYVRHRRHSNRRLRTVVDLAPVLVRDGNLIYKGIIDLRDPYMLIARGLYSQNTDVHFKLVRCDLAQ